MAFVFADVPKPEPQNPFSNVSSNLFAFSNQKPKLEIVEPIPPNAGECYDYWAITNSHCSGDIRLYRQCEPTMTGGEWVSKTENCKDYGNNWSCLINDCVAISFNPILDNLETIFWAIITIAIILLIVFFAYRKVKG